MTESKYTIEEKEGRFILTDNETKQSTTHATYQDAEDYAHHVTLQAGMHKNENKIIT